MLPYLAENLVCLFTFVAPANQSVGIFFFPGKWAELNNQRLFHSKFLHGFRFKGVVFLLSCSPYPLHEGSICPIWSQDTDVALSTPSGYCLFYFGCIPAACFEQVIRLLLLEEYVCMKWDLAMNEIFTLSLRQISCRSRAIRIGFLECNRSTTPSDVSETCSVWSEIRLEPEILNE